VNTVPPTIRSYAQTLADIREEFPSFRVQLKENSRLMRAIDWVFYLASLGRVRTFLSMYLTTIGSTCYVPAPILAEAMVNRFSNSMLAITMEHERVHLRQQQRYGRLLFSLLYLLAPVPLFGAWYRCRFEREAYEVTIRRSVVLLGEGYLNDRTKQSVLDQFRGPMYAWMWPWSASNERWYADVCAQARNDLACYRAGLAAQQLLR
jgi:hypothetical protein